jgi:hypothetical protein
MFTVDINKVPYSKSFSIVISILSAILGPLYFLYTFYNPLFLKLDILRLLLLCLAIGFPVIMVNSLLWAMISKEEKPIDKVIFLLMGGIQCLFVFYLPPCFGFYLTFDARSAINIAIGINLGCFVGHYIELWFKISKQRIKLNRAASSSPSLADPGQSSPSSSGGTVDV